MKKLTSFGLLVIALMLSGCTAKKLGVTNTMNNTNQVTINQNTNQVPISNTNNAPRDFTYTDNTFGFTLTFPATWADYKVNKMKDGVTFGFIGQEMLFSVAVYTKDEWQRIKSEEGPTPTYLGENTQNVFGYAQAQDALNTTINDRMKEIPDIIKTFKTTGSQINAHLADWLTFSNPNGKYSFQYYSNWNAFVSKYNNKNSLFGPDANSGTGLGGVELSIFNGSPNEYIKYLTDNAAINFTSKKDITINGLPAVEVNYTGVANQIGHGVYLKNGNQIINIYINSQDENNIKLFNKILSTFELIK